MNTGMRKKIVLVIFVVLGLQNIFAQSRLSAELDLGYMIGFAENGSSYKITRSSYKMCTNSIRFSGVYHFTNTLSTGIGAGSERYETPGYNTLPIFALFRYAPLPFFPKGYVYTDLGYSIKVSSAYTSGLLYDLGIGYQWMLHKHFGLKAQIGYNLKQFKTDYQSSELSGEKVTQWRHSLVLSTGLVF